MENKVYWTTKNGDKIDVDKMDINHLRNVLKMLIRKSKVKKIGNIEACFQEDRIQEICDDYCDATEFDIW